ncbi:MAG: PilT/PilU family type 4a pilus ATPase [Deltaproteobacteria bacterium]|nr:PilT/PilU family type 4a pilus ATPase [Deltaproteobacteria bacterium]
MSALTSLVEAAYAAGASDLHIEPGLPPAFRIDGRLTVQPGPLAPKDTRAMARQVAGDALWERFLADRSLDLSRALAGVRCRINVLQSRRGVGLAVRLLRPGVATLEQLNLHPSLAELASLPHGLVLVSGPTGSGKSSTIAALVQELNTSRSAHVLTLEEPVEHWYRPSRAFIRQREVGADTPSYEQGLLDALREDPDVIVVGEMRRPETMRLTLDAAETGHLVFTTVHSATVSEALHRIISAFPADAQDGVRAQLAGSLQAVVCQHLTLRSDLGIRVPECSILRASDAARNVIRSGKLQRIESVMETGSEAGSYTRERYSRWLHGRSSFHIPSRKAPGKSAQPAEEAPASDGIPLPELSPLRRKGSPARSALDRALSRSDAPAHTVPPPSAGTGSPVFVLDDVEADAAAILSDLLKKS